MKLPRIDLGDQLRIAFGIGIAGVALTVIAGLFGFHDGSLWKTPQVLKRRVEATLRAENYPGLEVEMRGQQAVVRGVVANEAEIVRVQDAAMHAAGAGGTWAGGVTGVDVDEVVVGEIDSPFAWRAWRDGSSVVLSGSAPSINAIDMLNAEAAALFPLAVVLDDMHVAGGAPASNWTHVAREALRHLAALENGEARLEDSQLVLVGRADAAAAAEAERLVETTPAPFTARVEVEQTQ